MSRASTCLSHVQWCSLSLPRPTRLIFSSEASMVKSSPKFSSFYRGQNLTKYGVRCLVSSRAKPVLKFATAQTTNATHLYTLSEIVPICVYFLHLLNHQGHLATYLWSSVKIRPTDRPHKPSCSTGLSKLVHSRNMYILQGSYY